MTVTQIVKRFWEIATHGDMGSTADIQVYIQGEPDGGTLRNIGRIDFKNGCIVLVPKGQGMITLTIHNPNPENAVESVEIEIDAPAGYKRTLIEDEAVLLALKKDLKAFIESKWEMLMPMVSERLKRKAMTRTILNSRIRGRWRDKKRGRT